MRRSFTLGRGRSFARGGVPCEALVTLRLDLVLGAMLQSPPEAVEGQPEAQPEGPPTFTWRAPAGCPPEVRVRARLESLVGRDSASWERDVLARAQAYQILTDAGRDGWAATIVIESASGERVRQIEAPSCDALAEAAAVLVSVAMDPLSRQDVAMSESSPGEEPHPPEVLDKPPTVLPPVSSAAVPPPWVGVLAVRAGVGVGPLPFVGAVLGGRVGIRRKALRVDLGGAYWFSQQYGGHATAGVGSFALWVVDARICGVPGWRNVEFPLCGGTQIGGLWSRGTGLERPRTGTNIWVAGLASGGVLVRPSAVLAFGVEASLLVPFIRPQFVVDDAVEVHRPNPVAVEAMVVLEAHIPR